MKEKGIGRTSLMLVAVVMLVAAACGGSDEGADVASLSGDGTPLELAEAADEEVDLEAALLEFTACMRENGVDLPDPEVDSEGNVALGVRQAAQAADIPRDDMQAAFAECGDLLDGVAQLFERADITELEDQLLEFAQCMRDNGIDMPDPDLSFTPGDGDGPGEGGGPFGDVDFEDPEFQAAFDLCGEPLPNFGGRGGQGAGGNGGGE